MKLDFVSQKIISQLDNFYSVLPTYPFSKYSVGSIFFYDEIYERLKVDGVDMNYPNEIKAELWITAQKAFEVCEKRLPSEADEKELHRYYKSYLAMKYLHEKLPEQMFIYDENTGEKIVRVDLT